MCGEIRNANKIKKKNKSICQISLSPHMLRSPEEIKIEERLRTGGFEEGRELGGGGKKGEVYLKYKAPLTVELSKKKHIKTLQYLREA